MQSSPTDPLRSTCLNVQKSLAGTVLLNPVQKISMNDVSVPKIAIECYSCTFSSAAAGFLGAVSYACQKTAHFRWDTIVSLCLSSRSSRRRHEEKNDKASRSRMSQQLCGLTSSKRRGPINKGTPRRSKNSSYLRVHRNRDDPRADFRRSSTRAPLRAAMPKSRRGNGEF